MDVYREVTSFPAPSGASIEHHGDLLVVNTRWSQRDLDRKEKCSYVRSHTVDMAAGRVVSLTGPQEVTNEYVCVCVCFTCRKIFCALTQWESIKNIIKN